MLLWNCLFFECSYAGGIIPINLIIYFSLSASASAPKPALTTIRDMYQNRGGAFNNGNQKNNSSKGLKDSVGSTKQKTTINDMYKYQKRKWKNNLKVSFLSLFFYSYIDLIYHMYQVLTPISTLSAYIHHLHASPITLAIIYHLSRS